MSKKNNNLVLLIINVIPLFILVFLICFHITGVVAMEGDLFSTYFGFSSSLLTPCTYLYNYLSNNLNLDNVFLSLICSCFDIIIWVNLFYVVVRLFLLPIELLRGSIK